MMSASLRRASRAAALVALAVLAGCTEPLYVIPREDAIPADAVKMIPEMDTWPPILHDSAGWEQPVPMPGPVNTAGAEDSPFITLDGQWFFFFFTPDVQVPANEQLYDGCTGIYWSQRETDGWTEPERVVLCDDVSLDGCEFTHGDTLWFCSVRTGNYREIDLYWAVLRDGKWTDWRNAGHQLNVEHGVGESHITTDGRRMYTARSAGAGGHGGMDLWKLDRNSAGWDPPENLGSVVNGPGNENLPFVSSDGSELWFTANSRISEPGPALYRCVAIDSGTGWSEPEEIVSRFAGEPCLDDEGNIYFTHHYYTGTDPIQMIEADIYVCYRR